MKKLTLALASVILLPYGPAFSEVKLAKTVCGVVKGIDFSSAHVMKIEFENDAIGVELCAEIVGAFLAASMANQFELCIDVVEKKNGYAPWVPRIYRK